MTPVLTIDPRDTVTLPTEVAIAASGAVQRDGDNVFEIIVAIASGGIRGDAGRS